MKKIKKWIILLSLLLVVILLFLVIYKNKGERVDVSEDTYIHETTNELKKVQIRNNYYIVKNIVNKFYLEHIGVCNIEGDYKIIEEETEDFIDEQKKLSLEKMYSMLDKEYINENEITMEDILNKLGEIGSSEINITDMYVSEQSLDVSIYFVYGRLRNTKTSEISDFSMMVKVDSSNKTFSIFLQDYVQKYYNTIKEGDALQINVNGTIEPNEYNTYEYKHISDEEYVQDLFNQFKKEILFDRELVYNRLDEEYRTKKFDSLEDFVQYCKKNVRQNVVMSFSQYKKEKEDGYTRYVCLDQNGEVYIFNENAVMDYTLILDTYTVDLPEFIEEYYGIEPTNKVALNIQKIFDAMNDKDYKYVYGKLADGFKQNYFETLESFEEYIGENFYEKNEVEYLFYQKESEEYYSYTIKVSNEEDADEYKTLKIIMKLKETTQFEFSFNVE